MPRRQAILETLLIFALFCLHGGWPVPEVNEPYYLGKAIHYWNPQWASGDWFLQSADTHTVFYFSVGWLALLLKPTALAWTIRLLTWALLAWSWQRLSRAVAPRAWMSCVTAALFLFLLQHYNMAGEWVVGGAEAKGLAFVLVFLALEALVEGYWNRMWLLLGGASALHILVGGWAIVAAGTVWLERNAALLYEAVRGKSKTPFPIRSVLFAWLAPLAAVVLALPGLLPPLAMNRGVAPNLAAEAYRIYVFERFPHHLDPAKFWADGFVLPYVLLVVLWLVLRPTTADNPGARRLWSFTAVSVVIALLGAAIGLWGQHHREAAAAWMRFYWFRPADVAVPLGLALLSVRWMIEQKFRVALALVSAVAVFHPVDCAVLKLFSKPPFGERQIDGDAWRSVVLWAAGRHEGPAFPRQPRADKLRNYLQWLDVCHWVADPRHTPPEACFLVPRTAYTFKWYAGRGEVVNWKEAPQDAVRLVDWWRRIQAIYATGNPPPADKYYIWLADVGPVKLRKLADEYHADYLVTQVSAPRLLLPIVYDNETYVVYRLRE